MARLSWRSAISLAVALLAGASAYVLYVDATASSPVVVATRPLQAPVPLEAQMVAVTQMPAVAVHPKAVTDPATVVGKVLRRDVEAGEPLLLTDVAPGEGAGLSLYLQGDQHAFFVPARLEEGLGGAVQPGDRVDVIFVGGQGSGAVARTLLENLPVLQVRDEEGRRWEEGRPLGVLLAVSADQAERLAYALTYGRVYLALASATGGEGGSGGITWDNLFLRRPTAVPAPGTAGPPPVDEPGASPQGTEGAGAAATGGDVGPEPGGEANVDTGSAPAETSSGADVPAGSAPIPLVDPAWVGEGEDAP